MLKPGQTKLDRDYYKDATTEKPNGQQVLSNYERYRSIYDQNQNKNVMVGDYKVPAKSMNTMSKLSFFSNLIFVILQLDMSSSTNLHFSTIPHVVEPNNIRLP
jgi:hypothetical protein